MLPDLSGEEVLQQLEGIPYFGLWSVGIAGYVPLLLLELFSLWAMTAILVSIARLITNRFANVITIAVANILLMLGSYFYQALAESETIISRVTISTYEGVVFGEEIANPAYIGGALRTVYRAILNVLPTGQQIMITEEAVTHPIRMYLCSVIMIVLFTGMGLFFFRKKDIK